MFSFEGINFLLILGVNVLYMVVGALWYGPLFAKPWMKIKGLKEEDLTGAGAAYGISFVASFIGLTLLAILHNALDISDKWDGIALGLIVASIYGAYKSNDIVYDKPKGQANRAKDWFLNLGYIVIVFALAGYLFT